MDRWIAVLGAVALFGVGCGAPELYEAEDAISQEVQSEAALQEQQPEDIGIAVTCQPGTFVEYCYDSGGCFEHSQCGAGCNAYNNWRCKQYKVTISGKTYYYRAYCASTPVITCEFAKAPSCKQTCS